MRRKDKAVIDEDEMREPLRKAKYVTIAMCLENKPYLVTLSHGFDIEHNCIYFHCAREGKKIDILKANSLVWGQAFLDGSYQQGYCDHLYHTTQFQGKVTFVEDINEKRHALTVMINQLDDNPDDVITKQVTPRSLERVCIGRINIDYMTSKKADKVIISI